MGRKTKLTPETRAKILQAIELGATYELAAGYGGVCRDTLNEWLKSKADFADAVRTAEATAAMVWLARIRKAADNGDWHASAWMLERRYPRSYGRTVQEQEHSGNIDIKITKRPEVVIHYVNDWRNRTGGGDE